jgi:hypothetical protein
VTNQTEATPAINPFLEVFIDKTFRSVPTSCDPRSFEIDLVTRMRKGMIP